MRVLFLAHRLPYPPNKGEKIRSFNMIEHLARRHSVAVATLVDDSSDIDNARSLSKRVAGLLFERIDQPGRRLFALRALAFGGGITVRYFYSPRLQNRVDDLIDREKFDAVVCSSSPMAEYVFRSRHLSGQLGGAIKVMDLIDVDSYKWRQYAERSSRLTAWLYKRESELLGEYEREIYRRFDWTLVVTEQERRYFASEEQSKLLAVGNGVDLEHFRPVPSENKGREPTIVFTGIMDYWPNIDGMRWFLADVFPLVRNQVPARLFIVGNRPTREVRSWNDHDGVTVTGFVPDVRDYVASADVCIAPLRVARGIQNKVLEAMAMGKPLVSSPEAFEGIRATPGSDLLVAKDASSFANAIVSLIRNPDEGRRLGANARRCMERHYSWETNLSALDRILSVTAPG